MNQLFAQRRSRWQTQCLRYLRYVFNDHFVLALLFLLGLILYQYNQLLKSLPANPLYLYLGMALWLGTAISLGRIATYLEKADLHYLLVQEVAVLQTLKAAQRRSLMLGLVLVTLANLFLWPLFLALGHPVWQLVTLLALTWSLKVLVHTAKSRQLYQGEQLFWERAIAYENKRQQSWLQFFALFTQVKGITTSVKSRAYLNGFLKRLPQRPEKLWSHLYLRAYLRSGDYLALTLRLGLLALVCLVFLASQPLLAFLVVLLFNYLLYFQLLALYQHYDYYPLHFLYPDDKRGRLRSLLSLLAWILGFLTLLEVLVMLLVGQWLQVVWLLLGTLAILLIYGPYRGKKLIDEAR